MKTLILLALIAVCSAHLKWSVENSHFYSFSDYESEFGKNYTDEQEHQIRKTIFQQNLEKIRQINSDPKNTWKAGVNQFTDRLSSELNTLKGLHRSLSFQTRRPNFHTTIVDPIKDLPASIDWREKGVVSEVRNQGGCGSCWAFSAVAVLESHVAIQTGKLLAFSEQQLVDCTPNPKHCGGSGGCEGATQPLGFDYVAKIGGVVARDDYKYTARDGTCQDSKKTKIATIQGFNSLPTNDYNSLMNAVATQGPVAISVAADAWFSYSSGIYNGNCGATIDHAVVAVGYGADSQGRKYWIIRNSWGTGWGEHGHIRVHREDSAADVKCEVDYNPSAGSACEGGPSQITVCGICGIYSDSSIPYGGKLI